MVITATLLHGVATTPVVGRVGVQQTSARDRAQLVAYAYLTGLAWLMLRLWAMHQGIPPSKPFRRRASAVPSPAAEAPIVATELTALIPAQSHGSGCRVAVSRASLDDGGPAAAAAGAYPLIVQSMGSST